MIAGDPFSKRLVSLNEISLRETDHDFWSTVGKATYFSPGQMKNGYTSPKLICAMVSWTYKENCLDLFTNLFDASNEIKLLLFRPKLTPALAKERTSTF